MSIPRMADLSSLVVTAVGVLAAVSLAACAGAASARLLLRASRNNDSEAESGQTRAE